MGVSGTTVHVVIATQGEYSDRTEWVCAVFTDETEAKNAAETRGRIAREVSAQADEWLRLRNIHRRDSPQASHEATIASYRSWRDPSALTAEHKAELDSENAARDAFIAEHGQCPSPEADSFTVVAVRLNEWGRWDACDIDGDGNV